MISIYNTAGRDQTCDIWMHVSTLPVGLWYLANFPQIFTEIIKQSLIAKVNTILILNVKI